MAFRIAEPAAVTAAFPRTAMRDIAARLRVLLFAGKSE